VVYPSYAWLIEMHVFLMREVWGESCFGPHRPELLESALARPIHAACYEGADGVRQAAYLFQGLMMNHGFVQGNKRTAYAMLEWFLHENRLGALAASDEDIVQFCLRTENEKWTIEQIDQWLRSHLAA
jgi:death-on-curing protein